MEWRKLELEMVSFALLVYPYLRICVARLIRASYTKCTPACVRTLAFMCVCAGRCGYTCERRLVCILCVPQLSIHKACDCSRTPCTHLRARFQFIPAHLRERVRASVRMYLPASGYSVRRISVSFFYTWQTLQFIFGLNFV